MKKLMFAAAFAATTVAFGSVQKEAQVYQLRIAARTTQAVMAEKTVTTNDNPFVKDNYRLYRDTTQYVLNGLIWGCGCDTIKGEYKDSKIAVTNGLNAYEGAMVWVPKTMQFVLGTDQTTDLGCRFINAIGRTGNKCEGVFQIRTAGGCKDNPSGGSLVLAGFGQLGRTKADLNTASNSNCTYYVNNISGSFAGWLAYPTYNTAAQQSDCPHCDDWEIKSECVPAGAWEWCACADVSDETNTAAYGEWYIRYNAAMSAAYSKAKHIGEVYDFGGRNEKNDVWVNFCKRFIAAPAN